MNGSEINNKTSVPIKNEKIYNALPLTGLFLGSGIAFYKKTSVFDFFIISAIGLAVGTLTKNKLKYGNLSGWH